jgi:hypothetical protein
MAKYLAARYVEEVLDGITDRQLIYP